MKDKDPALSVTNPRLIAAIYFGLLSVVGTILINAFLTVIGIEELIPVFEAIILGVVVAGATGALFGEQIVHCKKPYKLKTFLLGFGMVIVSLPVFDFGLLMFIIRENTCILPMYTMHSTLYFYFGVLAYSYALFGVLLAIASGLAALYLRGQLVYDILHIYEESSIETQRLPLKIKPMREPKTRKRNGVSTKNPKV
jgi:hypothetical protein